MFSVLAHTTSTKTATLYHKTSQTANRRGKCPERNHLGKKCFAFSSLDKSNIPDILAKA